MNMDEKLPYYMAYPMPLLYDDERQNQRDYEYMKSVYPGTAKRLIPYIEEECDRLEYMGSVMYDEYPDTAAMEQLVDKAYIRAGRPEPEDWSRALLSSLLYDEICYRRNRRRDFKQRLYPR